MSFDGFNIYSEKDWTKNVGRLDGQTGWSGINQAGEKTMSYQVAFVIKANNRLTDIFNAVGKDGRRDNQTTQIGWWIPTRGEQVPPEDWTMNLMDVNLYPVITQSNLRMLQTIYKRGLYDKVGGRIDAPYNNPVEPDSFKFQNSWAFNSAGYLDKVTKSGDSVLTDADYWVPIKPKTTISEDRLVIAIEGSSLKTKLPEVRWGSKVPFTFQILDYSLETTAWIIRMRETVELTFTDDPNSCTLPSTACIDPDAVLESASLFAVKSALSLAMVAMIAF